MKTARIAGILCIAFIFAFIFIGQYLSATDAGKKEGLREIEGKIEKQQAYNREHEARITLKGRVAGILGGFSNSLHHDPSLLAELILTKCEQHKLDPFLVLGVIAAESSFNSLAVSPKGALGLMQVQPFTANHIAPEIELDPENAASELFDNNLNISLGTRYLASLLKRFGNLRLALEAYNRGPTSLRRQLNDGEELEWGYAQKVIHHYRRLKQGTAL